MIIPSGVLDILNEFYAMWYFSSNNA